MPDVGTDAVEPVGAVEGEAVDAVEPVGPRDTAPEPRRRFRLWPRTVRVRITAIATIAFAIALSAAAVGLVRFVHNELNDRIHETNQQQLNQLVAAAQQGTYPAPTPEARCVPVVGGLICPTNRYPSREGYYATSEIVRT